ncbi:MAG: helicase-associated domain-containing protein, partial [Sciscionella sp.]
MPVGSFAEWLRQMPEAEVLSLLRRRPDLALPAPATSTVLATRAATRASVARAAEELDAFTLAVTDALLLAKADHAEVGLQPLAALLGPTVSGDALHAALARLRELGLSWGTERAIRIVPTLREVSSPFPGGLGRSNPDLARTDIAAALGTLDAGQRQLLEVLAAGPPIGTTRHAEQPDAPTTGLLRAGLLIRRDPQTVELPREVGVALRGAFPMGEVPLRAPELPIENPGASIVDATAAGAAAQLSRHAEALLRSMAANPSPVLRSGGIGVREVRRYARELEVTEATAGLLLELLRAAGLIGAQEGAQPQWVPTVAMDRWALGSAAQRWAQLALAWLEMPRLAGLIGRPDGSGKTLGALTESLESVQAPAARRRTLQALRELPSGSAPGDKDALAELLRWRRPRRSGGLHAQG